MPSQRNNLNKKHNRLLYLAFEQAKINLGSTKSNPSVGCIVEKDDTVLSSGVTSFNGRPHAEFNALNKNKDFKKASLYVTMEPCCHFGKTPPCTRIIIKKKPDLIHIHSRRGVDFYGGLASFLLRKTCLLTRRVDNRERFILFKVKYFFYAWLINSTWYWCSSRI